MAYVINYVGAGGKTSSILEKADEYALEGKKVVVTTTTHLLMPRVIPEGTDHLSEDLEDARAIWKAGKIVWYGHPMGANGCFTLTDLTEWEALCREADVILVEGDGSRRHPVKVPKLSKEPVIFPGTDKIMVLFGLSGLGQTVEKVCHRPELVLEILNRPDYLAYIRKADEGRNPCPEHSEDRIPYQKEKKIYDESHILTEEDFILLIYYGYLLPLRERYPQAEIEIRLNQAVTDRLKEQAKRILDSGVFSDIPVSITNYDREVRV